MENQSPKLLQIVDSWLDIMIDQLHQALDTYEIGKLDGPLWNSIVGQVIASGGDVRAVIIKFLEYGRLRDMRVGRGAAIGSGNLNRKRSPWYSKTKYREIARLREVMAFNLSNSVIQDIETTTRDFNIEV
jgi:hypothetical protein